MERTIFNIKEFNKSMNKFHSSKVLEENERVDTYLANKQMFNESIMEIKMEKDANFLHNLADVYMRDKITSLQEENEQLTASNIKNPSQETTKKIEENEKEIVKLSEDVNDWNIIFESVFYDTQDLYIELNESAAFYAPTVYSKKLGRFNNRFKTEMNILTEAEEINLYRSTFTKNIENNFSRPIEEGTFNDKYSNEIKLILENMTNKNVKLNDIDVELLSKYAIFENTIINEIKRVLVPDAIEESVLEFSNSADPDYFSTFERNVNSINTDIDNKCKCLGNLLAPKMFKDAAQDDLPLDPELLRGSGKIIIIKKDFINPMDVNSLADSAVDPLDTIETPDATDMSQFSEM